MATITGYRAADGAGNRYRWHATRSAALAHMDKLNKQNRTDFGAVYDANHECWIQEGEFSESEARLYGLI